jgi:uncharacterized protein (UPF0210 family)
VFALSSTECLKGDVDSMKKKVNGMLVKNVLKEVEAILSLDDRLGWVDVTKLRIAYRRAKDAKAI